MISSPSKVNYSKARIKVCYGRRRLAIGSKDIVLEYKAPSLMEHWPRPSSIFGAYGGAREALRQGQFVRLT